MIFESSVWRVYLARELRDIRRRLEAASRSTRSDVLERMAARLEVFFFTSAFVIRKLMKSNKLSDDIAAQGISARSYPRLSDGRELIFLDRFVFDRFYDLDSATAKEVSGRDLCNTLIHSFVFSPNADDEPSSRFTSVFVNSDRSNEHGLYQVALQDYVAFLEDVVDDEIDALSFNRATGKITKPRRRERLFESVLEAIGH